jgi:hypothetical protein
LVRLLAEEFDDVKFLRRVLKRMKAQVQK